MLKLPDELTPLEIKILNLYASEYPYLQDQLRAAKFISRQHNGYGFYTNLNCAEAELLEPRNAQPGASALIDGELCGFLLWIEDGSIQFLEGYPLGGDAWPGNRYPLPENTAAVSTNVTDLRMVY